MILYASIDPLVELEVAAMNVFRNGMGEYQRLLMARYLKQIDDLEFIRGVDALLDYELKNLSEKEREWIKEETQRRRATPEDSFFETV